MHVLKRIQRWWNFLMFEKLSATEVQYRMYVQIACITCHALSLLLYIHTVRENFILINYAMRKYFHLKHFHSKIGLSYWDGKMFGEGRGWIKMKCFLHELHKSLMLHGWWCLNSFNSFAKECCSLQLICENV